MIKKILILSIIISVFIGIIYSARKNVGTNTTEIEVTSVERGQIDSSILAPGNLEFKEEVELRSEVFGKVSKINVKESDYVTKGDIILRIDPTSFLAEVAQYQASAKQKEIAINSKKLQIEQYVIQLTRTKKLHTQGLIDDSSLEQNTLDLRMSKMELQMQQQLLKQATAQLTQAQDNLDKTIIRAPISGIVSFVDVKVGETVIAGAASIAGSVLMRIADPSEVLTELHVSEADINKVEIGQSVKVDAIAYPDKQFDGKVKFIASTAIEGSHGKGKGFNVKVLIDNIDGSKIRSGISCRAEIYYNSTEQVLTVPVKSILFEKNDATNKQDEKYFSYVMLVKDNIVEKRQVRLGLSNDQYQEIKSGLDSNDILVSGPYRKLKHLKTGHHVTIRNDV